LKYKILVALFSVLFFKISISGDYSVHGMVSGNIVETNDRLIIQGATFISNGDSESVINIGKKLKKEIIISNVRILSNNHKIRDTTGKAGIVVIDNADSNAKVSLREIDIYSRNADISSVSTNKDVCASLICSSVGNYDSIRSISATATGQTNIYANQGQRSDIRKGANR
jgi:hypothetical protein